MPKLTEYPQATTFDEGDILIKDGVNGTKKILASDAEIFFTKTVDDKIGALSETIDELLESKADIDGYYEGMTVGNADQLVSAAKIEDSVPYNFRTSAGSASVANREIDKIIGGTIAWNQIFNAVHSTYTVNDVECIRDDDTTGKINGTASASGNIQVSSVTIPTIADHKYFADSGANLPSGAFVSLSGIPLLNNAVSRGLFTYNQTIGIYFRIEFAAATVFNNVKITPQIFDLTQMFGSTIANYIYSLEQSTPGAGVAWFRKLFPKPYYARNTGELMSVRAAAHKMVGFNQWDEEWEQGTYDLSTGLPIYSAIYFRTKNPIHVFPSTKYHFSISNGSLSALYVFFYDGSDNILKVENKQQLSSYDITTPANCYYLRFVDVLRNNYDPSVASICINLSWDGGRDGEYEPYVEHVYPLDSDLELRGIPKLDADNQLYYDGDIYESDGTVTRKYGIVDLGSLGWGYSGGAFRAHIPMAYPTVSTEIANMICQAYCTVTWTSPSVSDKYITAFQWSSEDHQVAVVDSSYSDAATFKAAMSGVYLVYELSESTTETADAFENPQFVDDFGTEEYVDAEVAAGQRDVAVPVGHETIYRADLRAKLEMAPDSPDGDGDYIVRQTNGKNEYIPILFPADKLPAAPTSNGTYVLKCTVSGSTTTLSWEAQS